MSNTENREKSLSDGLQIPGLVQSLDPVEQLSFPGGPVTPTPESVTSQARMEDIPDLSNVDTARQLVPVMNQTLPATPFPVSSPGATSALLLGAQPLMTEALNGAIAQANTSSLRTPVIIRGSNKVRHSPRPPRGRRHIISIATLVMLSIITVGTLLAVSPMGLDAHIGSRSSATGSSLVQDSSGNSMSLVSQQATATAIVHQQTDGYVAGAGSGAVLTGSPGTWPLGVCTYWANLRYHELTGVWVTWLGNAYQWADGARQAGWNVSQSPHVPSIIVLEPGVQGASGYGHVAVVESMVNSTTVRTSNMNWFENGGGWDITSYANFTTGSGVYFIWK